jgi:hypothetical protein
MQRWRHGCAFIWLAVLALTTKCKYAKYVKYAQYDEYAILYSFTIFCILYICTIIKLISHIYHILHIYCSFWDKNDCLVPLTSYLAGIFQYLQRNKKLPPRVRAVDMLHVLLVLPFLLDGLLDPAVLEEHNRNHPL